MTGIRQSVVPLLIVVVLPLAAAGDVLVTKSGTEYRGKVIDQGDSYLLHKAGGGKVTFPKSMVREIRPGPTTADPGREPAAKPTTKPRSKLRGIEGEGAGTTPDEAFKSALVSAVEKAVGVLVDAKTIVDHDDVIQEKIITATNAFVDKHEVLRRWVKDGLHYCRIVARVVSRKLKQELEANRIKTREIRGEYIYDRILTEELARMSASQVLQACLRDLPQKVLTVRATGKTTPISSSRLRIPIEITVDTKAYAHEINRALPNISRVALAEKSGMAMFRRRNPAKALNDHVVKGMSLSNRRLYGIDDNPVFPPSGTLAPIVWFQGSGALAGPSKPRTAGQENTLLGQIVTTATRAGKKAVLLMIMTKMSSSGRARYTAFAVDKQAVDGLGLDPYRDPSVVIHVVLRDGARKKIGRSETVFRAGPLIMCIGEGPRFRVDGRSVGRWPVVRVHPGLRDFPVPSFAQSWRGYVYVDVPADKIRQIRSMDVFPVWRPGGTSKF